MKKYLALINSIYFCCSVSFSIPVFSKETTSKEVCFNFYIVTKVENQKSESSVYKKQIKIALKQLSLNQVVFDENQARLCPKFDFSKGIVKKIKWSNALKLSQPNDQNIDENLGDYYLRKLNIAITKLQNLSNDINKQPNIKYSRFIDLRPGKVIVKAENAFEKLIEHRNAFNDGKTDDLQIIRSTIDSAVENILFKLDSYKKESRSELLKKENERINNYEEIDRLSAESWSEGKLTLWNDLEAQNTSIELKNLLKHYRTKENQCLDVYIIPSAKTPSRTIKEVNKNGKWTVRGGAAISSEKFPRTTAGGGHAILLTYNSKKSEYRLAHEFAHLFLGKGNAHLEKKEKDLMHKDSKGGSYLNEIECDKISKNAALFFGGVKKRSK